MIEGLYSELSKRHYGYCFFGLGWFAECFHLFDRAGGLGP
jgi:hypothetical protein